MRIATSISSLMLSTFCTFGARAEEPAKDELLGRMPAVFKASEAQYRILLENIKGDPNQPRTFENDKVVTVPPEDWVSGFFPGSLWYLYEFSGDKGWKDAATDYTTRLEGIRHFAGHHDIGFMLGCSYGNGYRLTKEAAWRDVLIDGARALSTRYVQEAGTIRSWDHKPWQHPVIIDNMMNLELLTWASRETKEPRFREIALSHADKTLVNHFRENGSSYHLVDYDPTTGSAIKRQTVQGFTDDSSWARGQGWGLYGFTMMYRETGRPEYLAHAEKVARYIINHSRLPSDRIPYWDFDAPGIPDAVRDASAGALMASAFVELSKSARGDLGPQCLQIAREQLLSLSSPAYFAAPGTNGGFLLLHSTGHFKKNSEVDVPLNYADYYFLEALLRYREALGKSSK